MHTTPTGDAKPCCISNSQLKIGNSNVNSLSELVNSPEMNKIRLDMLAGNKISSCEGCYYHESHNMASGRTQANQNYLKYYNEAVPLTNIDGSLTEFKMRHFDIRFSNICNMKCRTCTEEYSSQWQLENKKFRTSFIIQSKGNKDFLQEVLDQIPNIKTAYFAGGETLITEEHYIMLEEMLRRGRADIKLRYNTNLSTLKYKDKDLLKLWSKFTWHIDIDASIDHYGNRAEYIRNGTVWAEIEENFKKLQAIPKIKLGVNTVLSIFNVLTLDEFYQYLFDNGMYRSGHFTFGIYKMTSPEYLTALVLPNKYKEDAIRRIKILVSNLREKGFGAPMIREIHPITSWIKSEDHWESQKDLFKQEILRLDTIRNENFANTFPELAELLDL